MSIVVFGVNHHTGPLAMLERLSVNADSLPKAIANLAARPNVREVVLLSTCNRTEVYAVAERFHGAYADIRDFFCEHGGLDPTELTPFLYSEHDEAAVNHLFQVACGLQSAVVGESEILGQVRTAWEVAQAEGGARGTLNLLFRHALETGKRARTETGIGRGTTSVSFAAVEMVLDRIGSLADRSVALVGAGEMGEGIALGLVRAGVASLTVVSRTSARAEVLVDRVRAAGVSAAMVPLDSLPAALADAEVVLCCTGSDAALIDAAMVAEARTPRLIVDIAVPRDVAAEVADLPDVTLLNLDDLRAWAAEGVAARAAHVHGVHDIVVDEVERFIVDSMARQAAPLVAQLRAKAETVRTAELARFESRLAALSEDHRALVEALTHGLVNKLLHRVSVRLKTDVGTPQGERNAAAVRDLFDLDER